MIVRLTILIIILLCLTYGILTGRIRRKCVMPGVGRRIQVTICIALLSVEDTFPISCGSSRALYTALKELGEQDHTPSLSGTR